MILFIFLFLYNFIYVQSPSCCGCGSTVSFVYEWKQNHHLDGFFPVLQPSLLLLIEMILYVYIHKRWYMYFMCASWRMLFEFRGVGLWAVVVWSPVWPLKGSEEGGDRGFGGNGIELFHGGGVGFLLWAYLGFLLSSSASCFDLTCTRFDLIVTLFLRSATWDQGQEFHFLLSMFSENTVYLYY